MECRVRRVMSSYRDTNKHIYSKLRGFPRSGKISALFDQPGFHYAVQSRKMVGEVFLSLEENPILSRQLSVLAVDCRYGLHALDYLGKWGKSKAVEIGVVGEVDKDLGRAALGIRTGGEGEGTSLVATRYGVVGNCRLVPACR